MFPFSPPDDLPVTRRVAVRVIVVDSGGRVLLLHTHDPTYPELGTWWELPGGGIEPGESLENAAVREVWEETAIDLDHDDFRRGLYWHRHATFRYRGARRLQCEAVVAIDVDADAPQIGGANRVDFEDEDYTGWAWWTVEAIRTSSERFYPGSLPTLLCEYLAGNEIDEPLEHWS